MCKKEKRLLKGDELTNRAIELGVSLGEIGYESGGRYVRFQCWRERLSYHRENYLVYGETLTFKYGGTKYG